MSGVFQPPPTWALPVIVDPTSGESIFNPIWLRWFIDLSKNLGTNGLPDNGGGIVAIQTFLQHETPWQSIDAFKGNVDNILSAAAYLPKQVSSLATQAFYTNDQSILASQIFGA